MNVPTPRTEESNPRTRDLDLQSTQQLVAMFVSENSTAVDAVTACVPVIAAAVDLIVERLQKGGRLHYVGAGTSGRIAVLDAAECAPTFGVSSDLVQAHLAGGTAAFARSIEGAEDDADGGAREVHCCIQHGDAVVGISASGRAPFVVAALAAARSLGALTIAMTNAPRSPLESECDLAIVLDTGAEPIAGSTRMKAGTAQKLALNALSTATMVRLGKVHDNLMVGLRATNEKLRRRALRLVARLVPADDERASTLLMHAGGDVKIAVVMGRFDVDANAARTRLSRAGGRLRTALESPR